MNRAKKNGAVFCFLCEIYYNNIDVSLCLLCAMFY
jgi:hypothetical protein